MLQFHPQFQSLTYSRCLSWARLKGGIHICSQIKDGISTLLKVIVEHDTRIKHINNAAMAFICLPSSEPEYDLNLSPID